MIPVTETILQTAYHYRWSIQFPVKDEAFLTCNFDSVNIRRLKEDLWECMSKDGSIERLPEIGTIMFLKEKLRRSHALADH